MPPEDGSAQPPAAPDSRTTIAMSERLAVVETKLSSAISDTTVIRASIHDINGELQKFVQAEQRCVDKLSQILEAIKDVPLILSTVGAFNDMRPDLRLIMEERAQRAGLATFGKRFTMIVGAIGGLIALLGGIAGGLIWVSQHLKPL